MNKQQIVTAIIVAAGSGKRIGGPIPKQFISINGHPVLYWTCQKFENSKIVRDIVLVLAESDIAEYLDMIQKWPFVKISAIVKGGKERHHSVKNALEHLAADTEYVAIHDGVRPFVSINSISRVIQDAFVHRAALLGVVPKDTIKMTADDKISKTLDRQHLVAVQTPQVFQRSLIQEAYNKAFAENNFSTDDAALVERLGVPVHVSLGEYTNIKITAPDDILIAHTFLKAGK